MANKEPWLAVNLSNILPGFGQIYSGDKIKGYIIISIYIVLHIVGAYLIFTPTGNVITGFSILVISLVVWFWNLFDAYGCAKNKNNHEFEFIRKQSKDPWLAMFLSRLFPGIGHFYIGKRLFGIFAVILGITVSLSPIFISFIISPIVVAGIAYLAYVFAPVHRDSKKLASVIAIFIFISSIFPIISAFTIRTYLVEARWIPSGSMEPALHGSLNQAEADKILVDKFSYRFQAPKRGDIIIFSPTEELRREQYEDAFIKRIIGLPGEKVELRDGKVYINNQKLQEDKYLSEEQKTSIDVCTSGNPSPYLSGTPTIPANSYLVLGDNRTQAYDSRCWGVVDRNLIIGKAYKRWFPFNRMSTL